MKRFLIVSGLVVLSLFCCAEDLYLTPDSVLGSTSFNAQGQTFRIWGIMPGDQAWERIARDALKQMLCGKMYKFIVGKEVLKVARFGRFGIKGKPQANIALKMLKMGLVKHNPSDLPKDEKIHAPYREAEAEAKKAGLGIWSR